MLRVSSSLGATLVEVFEVLEALELLEAYPENQSEDVDAREMNRITYPVFRAFGSTRAQCFDDC